MGRSPKRHFCFCNGLFILTFLFLALKLELRGALPPNTLLAFTALFSVLRIMWLSSTCDAEAVTLNFDFLIAFGLSRIKFRPVLLRNEIHVSVIMSVCYMHVWLRPYTYLSVLISNVLQIFIKIIMNISALIVHNALQFHYY